MKHTITITTLLLALVLGLSAQSQPSVTKEAPTTITTEKRIQVLQQLRDYLQLQNEMTRAQQRLETLGKQLQTDIQAMASTCKKEEQFDQNELLCKPPAKAEAASK